MKYHQISSTGWNGMFVFFGVFSCLKLEHSPRKPTPVTHRKSLDATVPWVELAVGMDPLIVAWALGQKTNKWHGNRLTSIEDLCIFNRFSQFFLGGWKFCRFGLRFGMYAYVCNMSWSNAATCVCFFFKSLR